MKTFRLPILLLVVSVLMEFGSLQTLAQSRTSGNSRNPGNARPVTPTPAPVSEGSRDIGRTRQSAETANPVSNGSRDNGRSSSGRTPIASPTPDIPQPTPPPRSPRLPVHDCPQLPIDEVPIGGVIIEDNAGESSGFWIYEDVRYGGDVILPENILMPEYSGYDFSESMKRSFDHQFTDMFVEEQAKGLMMSVGEDSEIMDIWPMFVPENAILVSRQEWSSSHSVLLIPGHEYVVLTWDHHYAKFVVTSLVRNRVVFDWAYQYGADDNSEVVTTDSGTPKGDKFQR